MVRVVLVGPAGCGKSALVRTWLADQRGSGAGGGGAGDTSDIAPTILEEYVIALEPHRGRECTLVDTSGMDVYWSLASGALANADVVVYVFDITRRDTLYAFPLFWRLVAESRGGGGGGAPVAALIMCATRADSSRALFAPTYSSRRALALEQTAGCSSGVATTVIDYVETSARTAQGLATLVAMVALAVEPPPSAAVAATHVPSDTASDGASPRSASSTPRFSPRRLTGDGCVIS